MVCFIREGFSVNTIKNVMNKFFNNKQTNTKLKYQTPFHEIDFKLLEVKHGRNKNGDRCAKGIFLNTITNEKYHIGTLLSEHNTELKVALRWHLQEFYRQHQEVEQEINNIPRFEKYDSTRYYTTKDNKIFCESDSGKQVGELFSRTIKYSTFREVSKHHIKVVDEENGFAWCRNIHTLEDFIIPKSVIES